MASQVRKIFVDTRFGKGDPSDFEYDLGETVSLPQNTICYVSEITIPCSFDNVHAGVNRVFVGEATSAGVLSARILQLPEGVYDRNMLATALQTALNATKPETFGAYSVTSTSSVGSSNNALSASLRFLTINLSKAGSFFVASDEDLRNPEWYRVTWKGLYNGPDFDTTNPRSLSAIVTWERHTLTSSLSSAFLDLRSRHALFLHSPSFGDYTSIGPGGVRTAICKIPIVEPYGSLLHIASGGLQHDYVTVSSRTLRLLKFRLRDSYGELVDLKGAHYSFTLVFAERAG